MTALPEVEKPSVLLAVTPKARVAPKPVHVLPLFSPLWPEGGQVQAQPANPGYFLFVGRVTASKGVRPGRSPMRTAASSSRRVRSVG